MMNNKKTCAPILFFLFSTHIRYNYPRLFLLLTHNMTEEEALSLRRYNFNINNYDCREITLVRKGVVARSAIVNRFHIDVWKCLSNYMLGVSCPANKFCKLDNHGSCINRIPVYVLKKCMIIDFLTVPNFTRMPAKNFYSELKKLMYWIRREFQYRMNIPIRRECLCCKQMPPMLESFLKYFAEGLVNVPSDTALLNIFIAYNACGDVIPRRTAQEASILDDFKEHCRMQLFCAEITAEAFLEKKSGSNKIFLEHIEDQVSMVEKYKALYYCLRHGVGDRKRKAEDFNQSEIRYVLSQEGNKRPDHLETIIYFFQDLNDDRCTREELAALANMNICYELDCMSESWSFASMFDLVQRAYFSLVTFKGGSSSSSAAAPDSNSSSNTESSDECD